MAEGVKRVELYWSAMILIEDRFAETPVIKRPRGTTPLIGVIALEQMGFKVDPATGKLVKRLPLMCVVIAFTLNSPLSFGAHVLRRSLHCSVGSRGLSVSGCLLSKLDHV
jgi:hypothetical protein